MRSVRLSVLPAAVVVVAAGALGLVGSQAAAQTVPAHHTASCQLNSPTGQVKHVIDLTFDNVHLTRDNPNVPSDLEQMPNLLNFMKRNGSVLSNMHTPLISHTANDILTTLTGTYGDKHGQSVANSYRVYNTNGTSSSASSFAYWTDPVTASKSTDTAPTMVTPTGGVAPAPWVPFTRAGCDVGAISTANIEMENPTTDVPVIFGPNSAQEAQVQAQIKQFGFPDLAAADYEGIAVHCAQVKTSVCAGNSGAVADTLPNEPGGYTGFQGLFGNKYVGPQIGGTTTATGVRVDDLSGQPLTNDFASQDVKGTYFGFPGFSPTASQTLGYIAAMQEHGVPVTYGYIADAHDSFGSGDPRYEATLKSYDQAFGQFFANLAAHGINQDNTVFVVSSDEGDHMAAVQKAGCNGVTTPCTYAPGQVGEVAANLTGLLTQQAGDPAKDFSIHSDSAPVVYVNGQPGATDPRTRALEHEFLGLTAPDPYASATVPVITRLADQTEQTILHMTTGDPHRTATFTPFANPDFFISPGPAKCTGPTGAQTGTSNACVVIDPGFTWNHGDFQPEITTNWAMFAGPGVAEQGIDHRTWADETDIRPTMLALAGLKDDYVSDGRVLVEDLTKRATPPALRAHDETVLRLGQVYKQINADVGKFGLATLTASTTATRTTDAALNASIDQRLAQLGADRTALATKIDVALNAAAFHGKQINEETAERWINQGLDLLNRASQLAATTH
ncbi:MAG TPA: hypothetical protein VGL06_20255 [Pseudonocardiaceae bacterium]